MMNDEIQLITDAQQGDTQAITILYQRHVQAIYRYVITRVNDVMVAEDITSDVFVRAIETLPNYQQRQVPFLGWLYHIAHGMVVDYYRHSKTRGADQSIEQIDIPLPEHFEHEIFAQMEQTALMEMIYQLTDEQQHIIMLRFIQGYSLRETAQLIGKKENAVKALQFRAVKALARLMGVKADKEQDE